jgi:predicted MFS family arabinose efflux permease
MADNRLPRDFQLLWASAAVSHLGSRISLLAMPTIAVLVLHAGPVAVGALTALGTLPMLAFSMLSGTLADRGNRRRIAVIADLVCMVATGSVPLVAAFGRLTIAQLYAVILVNGSFGNLNDITFYSIVPMVVQRSDFDRANARLEATNIVTAVSGPGVGGALIQLVGAARAVSADAISFLASALLLVRLRDRTHRTAGGVASSFRTDLVEGARFVFGDRRLRRLAIASAVSNLGGGIALAVLFIYLYRNVGLSPGGLGLIVMLTGIVGAFLALKAPAITRRVGYANALATSAAISGIGWVMLPLATHVPGAAALAIVVVAYLFMAVEMGLWNVSMITLRRAFTPDDMFGRMVASTRTVAQGTLPIGAILGGLLGAAAGIVPTLVLGGVLMGVAGSLALDRELRQVHAPPADVPAGEEAVQV